MPPKQARPTSLPSEFIDLGGGATPRHKDDPKILLTNKLPPRPKEPAKFKQLAQKLDETGLLDREDFDSAADMCNFLDFYNQTIVDKRQSDYDREITGMNEYYRKLWIQAIDASR